MNESDIISIGLVDDHELMRSGLKTLIQGWHNMKAVFESPDGHSVIKKLAKADVLPDIMLVDLQLPNYGDMIYSGAHLTRDLFSNYPGIKVLILSVQDDPVTMADLIERGAHGFLSKSSSPRELREAIESVHLYGSYINAKTLDALRKRLTKSEAKPSTKNDEITSREIEVLRLICQEMTADEIGEKLFISPKTVNGHRNNLLQKTGAKNISGLVMYAVKNGIVEVN